MSINRICAAVLSCAMTVSAANAQVYAELSDTYRELPELVNVGFVESEPSEYGLVNVSYETDNGEPIDMYENIAVSVNSQTAASLPSSYDLREYGHITPVKNQKHTGTCWAHAAIAAAESSLIKKGIADDTVDLSEAHLVWFALGAANKDQNDPLYGDGSVLKDMGLDSYSYGGHASWSRSTLGSWMGAADESDFPNVTETPQIDDAYRYEADYHLVNSFEISKDDRDTVKSYLMNNGALTLSYQANGEYGVQTEENGYAFYNTSGGSTNHAVTVIGWDDDYSASNFLTPPPGDGAWLLKNSWGDWWADDGYFWMSYYDTTIAKPLSSMELDTTDKYYSIYQYAGVNKGAFFYRDSYIRLASIFTKSDMYPLAAVAVQVGQSETPYELEIYSDATYGSPQGGTLVYTQKGTMKYAGLNTIELDKLVSIGEGKNFSVVITLKKGSSLCYSDEYSNETGRSFYSCVTTDGYQFKWIDSGIANNEGEAGFDVYLKAFTTEARVDNIRSSYNSGKMVISWDEIKGAQSYSVWQLEKGQQSYVHLGTSEKTSFTTTDVTEGKSYKYAISARLDGVSYNYGYQSYYQDAVGFTPTNPKVSAGNRAAKITWDAVERAERYAVYIYKDGKYTCLDSNIPYNSYIATGLTNDVKVGFKVKAYITQWSDASAIAYTTPNANADVPKNVKATAGDTEATVTWDAVDGAGKYAVYIYKDGGYTCLNSNIKTTSYIVTGLTNGVKTGFKVKAYVDQWSGASAMAYATPAVPNIVPQDVKAKAGNGQATITWSAVSGATKYAVYIYKDGKYTCLNSNIKTTSYTATDLENGVKVGFKVKAYAGKWSGASAMAYATPTDGNIIPQNVKATGGDTTATITWNAVAGAERYAVYIYKDGKYTCLDSKIKSNSYTVSDLENGTKVGFKVKAYINGAWSGASSMAYATPNA